MIKRYATLQSTLAASSKPRTANLEGVDYLIFPCIAIMSNIVVQGLGSQGPEFVPAEVLAELPESWNSRPVLYNHPPSLDMEANSPEVFVAQRLGQMFNTVLDSSGNIQPEVWINPGRLADINAEELATRLANPKSNPISVSCGVWLWVAQQSGTAPDGTPYEYVWQRIVPNHLAILPPEIPGACSVETGCRLGGFGDGKGDDKALNSLQLAPQSATVSRGEIDMNAKPSARVNVEGKTQDEGQGNKLDSRPGFLNRLFSSLFRNLVDDQGPSDRQVRDALSKLLRTVEPGFDWLDRIYQQSKTIIYYCWDNGGMHVFHRSYNHDEASGEITLNDDREEGEIVEQFVPFSPTPNTEPVANVPAVDVGVNASADASDNVPCACHSKDNHQTEEDNEVANASDPNSKPATPTTTPAVDTPVTTETPVQTPPATPATNPVTTPPPTSSLSPEEEEKAYLAAMPTSLRSMFDRHLAAEKVHRANLKKQILSKQVAKAYTEQNLEPMPTEALEALSSALGVNVNFSGVPNIDTDESRENRKPVSAWDRMMADRGKNKRGNKGEGERATTN